MLDLRIVKGFTKHERPKEENARPPNSKVVHHKTYSRCEGCGRERHHIEHFLGHWLCRQCQARKNMPLVGYQNCVKWETEQKLLKRRKPFLTWDDCKVLWKEYMNKGLSESQAKARIWSLKMRVVKSYNQYITSEQEKQKAANNNKFELPK